jgi:hypothetical protein
LGDGAVDIRQPEVAALGTVRELCVIEAEQVKHVIPGLMPPPAIHIVNAFG